MYKPFDKKRNVVYSAPVYVENFLYFLQGNYDKKKVTLYRYMPEKVLETVTDFNMEEVNLYNLAIVGDRKVYLEKWVEEGWDKENDCAMDTYQYYNKVIIKDFAGNTISEEIGCLNQSANGDWWLS